MTYIISYLEINLGCTISSTNYIVEFLGVLRVLLFILATFEVFQRCFLMLEIHFRYMVCMKTYLVCVVVYIYNMIYDINLTYINFIT